jgi:transcriptional regulator with XRE-family HTH domain
MNNHPSMEQLAGQRIRALRLRRTWTQQELATQMRSTGGRYAKWHQTTVAKIEAATRPLRVNELGDVAAVLGVTAIELLADDGSSDGHAMQTVWERVERLERIKSQYDLICRIVRRTQ